MEKSIIIIGGGIAGLAAGCYARMNGFHTQIFELHNLPGGLCTAWERQEYVFDGCIHYLFGSGTGQPFNKIWKELGALEGRQVIHHDELMRVTSPEGKTLVVYADPDRLEEHMKALSPADSPLIEQFCRAIRVFTHFDMSILQEKPRSLWTPQDWAVFSQKMLPFMPTLTRWGMLSAEDFARQFKDPFLRQAVPQMFSWPEIPMIAALSLLAYMHTKNAGFPQGASLEFARAIERRYKNLEGEIFYNAQVERILVKNNRAAGIRLYNDEEYFADYVISAADGRNTIFEMLGGEYTNREIRRFYDGSFPIHSMIQVSLGVNRDFSSKPHWSIHLLNQPVLIAGQERSEIGVKHYCFDPTLAPPGKSVLEVMLRNNFGYFQRIYGHRLYDTEQDQVADIVIDLIEKIYPGIHQDIEMIDVATPLSYERYTSNWQGSSCGWLLTKKTMFYMMRGMSKTLPGLKNFYLAGQWVEPGGSVPIVAMSGRNAVQLICYAEGLPFITTEG
jgi:phytoene dehydrogenase-like protein